MQEQRIDHPFTDPITGREVVLRFIGPEPSFWDGSAGVAHPDCPVLAGVSVALDAFYCTACRWNGRITGAWAVDMIRAARGVEEFEVDDHLHPIDGEGGYCGCCGNELPEGHADDLWCSRCLGHVGSLGPLWERTWEAITGEECPHAVCEGEGGESDGTGA